MKKALLLVFALAPICLLAQTPRGYFDLAIKERDQRQKIEYFTKAIALKTDYAEAFLYRGIAKRKLKDYDGAMADMNKSIQIKPDYATAYNSRAGIHKRFGDNEAAMADYNKAIKLYPGYAIAYNNRGLLHNRMGDYEYAVNDFNKAVELKPSFSDAFHNRGFSKMELRQYDAAIEDFNKAISLDPKDHYAYNNRGATYNYKGDRGRALEDLGKAIEIKPNYHEAYANRAAVLLTVRQFELAKADCEKALDIRPGYQKVQVTLDAIEKRQKRYEEFGPSIRFMPEKPLRTGVLNIVPLNLPTVLAYSFESDRPVDELALSILIDEEPTDLFDLTKVELAENIMDKHYRYTFNSSITFDQEGPHTVKFESGNEEIHSSAFSSLVEYQVVLPRKKAHAVFWLPEVDDEVVVGVTDAMTDLFNKFNTFDMESVQVLNGEEATFASLTSAVKEAEVKLVAESPQSDNYLIVYMSAQLKYEDEQYFMIRGDQQTKLDMEGVLPVSEYGPYRPLLFFHGHLTDQTTLNADDSDPYDELDYALTAASAFYQATRLSGSTQFDDMDFIEQIDRLIFKLRTDYNADGYITLQEFHNEAAKTRKEGLTNGLGKIRIDWSNYRVGKSKDFVLSEAVKVK
ncbi:MAG: tetratricopeptide repeat protein [Bacteroidota bacterium]